MREAVICEPVRTPIGRYGGVFASLAAVDLAVPAEWGFGAAERDRTNVHGSGISLGHAVGVTGCRMLTALARELHRRRARYGLESMCMGGGQGLAAVFERVAA